MSELLDRIDKYQSAINERRPFEGELLKQLQAYYRIGLTWSSNAIEGNSLTLTETKVLLEDGLTIGGKPLKDTYEAVGHAAAYDYMFGLINERKINAEDIKTLHKLFYNAIGAENAGVWRGVNIMVTGSAHKFPTPEALEKLMAGLDDWALRERGNMHPVDFAALYHLKFVTIHPFIDGNGRVARLIMNAALIQDGYMLALVPPVVRLDYMHAIQAYQHNGDATGFREFIAERVYESQKEIMRLLSIPKPEIW